MTISDEWYRLGVSLHMAKRWGAAAGCFARVGGEDYRALTNLGWNRHLAGRTEEAAAALMAASGLAPADGVTAALLGQVYLTLGEDALALNWARDAVAQAPESPIAHTALAFALFLNGEWEAGWREYEWRYQYRPEMYPPRSQPLWRGEYVDRLWVEAEQGFGDTIFGLRWLRAAGERCGELSLFVQPELYGWVANYLRETGVRYDIAPLPRPAPRADAWCPLLSLPAAMGVGAPIAKPDWPVRPEPIYPGRKIGICWRGNPAHESAHYRDVPLPYWLPLTEIPEIELSSFQVGETNELAEMGTLPLIADRAPEITNFADAAKLLGEFDLLMTVDTAIAHLAGTLGVPTWLLLNQRGQDFRWGRLDATPWYPSVRIIRRGLDEDWAAVIARVARELRG